MRRPKYDARKFTWRGAGAVMDNGCDKRSYFYTTPWMRSCRHSESVRWRTTKNCQKSRAAPAPPTPPPSRVRRPCPDSYHSESGGTKGLCPGYNIVCFWRASPRSGWLVMQLVYPPKFLAAAEESSGDPSTYMACMYLPKAL